MDRRAIIALSSGHLVTDLSTGALFAFLPFFTSRFHLSYTLTAVLALVGLVTSSLVQPFFGLWSDKRGAAWFLPGGVMLAGGGIALAAASPNYALVVACICCSGIGNAAFHPEGSKFANYVAGRKQTSGIGMFMIGGNIGSALGPIIATPIILWLGLSGGLLLAVPACAAAALLGGTLSRLRSFVPNRPRAETDQASEQPGALALLLTVIGLRSAVWFGLLTFVPLWMVSRGHSKAAGNNMISLMLAGGVLGTLLIGAFSDRVGPQRALQGTQAVLTPLALIFVLIGGIPGAVSLTLLGAAITGSFTITIVLGQQYLPNHIGMAAGLVIGLGMGLGGVFAVSLGAIADSIDLRTALLACAAAPAVGTLLALFLPDSHVPSEFVPEPVAP
jgi:FSR family fosmidomycin resistance protein-like MFS transporter